MAATSAVATDKLIIVRDNFSSIAAQTMLCQGKMSPCFSRFEFIGNQKDKINAIRDLVIMAGNEVSIDVTVPNLYMDALKFNLSAHQFTTMPPNVALKVPTSTTSNVGLKHCSSSFVVAEDITAFQTAILPVISTGKL